MKVAFCLAENRADSPLDERFGRAGWFALTDGEEGRVLEIIENTAKNEPSGAGSLAIQLLLDRGAGAIVAPEFGPKAYDALKTLKLELFKQGDHRTLAGAWQGWKTGTLAKADQPGPAGLHRA